VRTFWLGALRVARAGKMRLAVTMVFRFEAVRGSTPKNPFELSDARYFVWRTGGSGLVMSRLYVERPSLSELDHFEMGYTNLWVMLRVGLWLGGKREGTWPANEAAGSFSDKGLFYAFDATQKPSHWRLLEDGETYYGFGSEAEGTAWCEDLARQGNPLMLAQLLEDVYWH
jgi:hypothetical protein